VEPRYKFTTSPGETMIARMQKSMKEKDQGFTLIELLVVIVIIGILAAIAIPLFLNQRKKGVDASLKSDLKSAATTVESWIVDHPTDVIADDTVINAATDTAGTGALTGMTASDGNTVKLTKSVLTVGAYCIYAFNGSASDAVDATHVMTYNSLKGGLQSTVGAPSCP
jgi:type IV pilus assembly protein PilA